MKVTSFLVTQVACWALVLTVEAVHSNAAERHKQHPVSFSRRVAFELTYLNRDLIWVGDPVSPTASAYAKPDARPIATDFYVTTTTENHESPSRHYFREARIATEGNVRTVYAFTASREKVIGTIDDEGHFLPNEFYKNNRELLPTWPVDTSVLAYDEKEQALYKEVEVPGPQISESLDFLPLKLSDAKGNPVVGNFSIDYATSNNSSVSQTAVVSLTLQSEGKTITLAKAIVPKVFRRGDIQLGSYDNSTATYLPEAAYRKDAIENKDSEPSVTVTLAGEFTSSVDSDAESLIVNEAPPAADRPKALPAEIAIDGKFDDWRNVAGVDDRRGDSVPYLDYVPDVDLLEFKVAHDDEHIYLYARVAGQVGRSHPNGGRSYFYAYMDVDQNAGTGFLPSRDDECYYGVDIGDDCEVQFEFVNNAFRKAFYGFCGLGGDDHVLQQKVTIGKSQYGRLDANGVERAHYKSEYIYRDGITEITEDLKLGTSDSIQVAVSPDGREVEVVSDLTGFLKDPNGRPTVKLGQTIDVAAGMECDSKAYLGKTKWAADSTSAIRGYQLSPRRWSGHLQTTIGSVTPHQTHHCPSGARSCDWDQILSAFATGLGRPRRHWP